MRHRIHNRRGFTAVEIAMVATVIAILALLILPIFRQRAEDARLVAAEDELQSLVKALLLVEADMATEGSFLPRLNDLTNREGNAPRIRWTDDVGWELIDQNEYDTSAIQDTWRGPYVAVKKYETLSNLFAFDPYIVAQDAATPDFILQSFGDPDVVYNTDDPDDRYPLDPWGSPYILFGPETDYNTRALYSLGPDRSPSSGIPAPTANDYLDRDLLGTGDDFEFLF